MFHIQTGRPWLWEEGTLVAQPTEERLESVKVVVYLLQAQDVWLVGQDLF